MKQWKLVLVALLAILLVCACGFSAIAEDQATCNHPESALEKKYTSDEELATCYGYKYYNVVCSKCGKVLSEGVKEDVKIEHKWGSWEVETPMACGVDKVEKRQCEKCLTIERKTTKAPAAHNFQVTFTSAATCEVAGYQVETCQNDVDGTQCGKTRTITLDKLPHVHNDDRDHWFATTEATCTVDGLMVNYCVNCGFDPIYKTIPATGHKFNGKVDAGESVAKEATCTEAGSFEDQCENEPNGVRCTAKQVTAIKALGHKLEENWTYNDSEKYPDCTHDLIGTKKCTRAGCTYKETVVVGKALGHNPVVKVIKEATETEAGDSNIICATCGVILEAHIQIPSLNDAKAAEEAAKAAAAEEAAKAMHYGSTITSFGPTTRELIGGKTWNRVTPIDLSVEGTFTYPLIAANEYTAGTMTVTIKDGKATVSYKVANSQIKVKSESLIIYKSLDELKAGNGAAFALNAPIDVAQAFGEDSKVIIALKLVADFSANGAGIGDFKADTAAISAMTAIID